MILDRRFVDAASCKVTQWPRLEALLAFVSEGDIVGGALGLARRNLDDLRRLVCSRPRLVVVVVDRVGARVSGFRG